MDTHSNLKIHSVHRKQRNYVSNYLFLPLSVGVTLKRVQDSCDKKYLCVVGISCAFRPPSLHLTCPLSCRSALQCLSQRLLKTVRKAMFCPFWICTNKWKIWKKNSRKYYVFDSMSTISSLKPDVGTATIQLGSQTSRTK